MLRTCLILLSALISSTAIGETIDRALTLDVGTGLLIRVSVTVDEAGTPTGATVINGQEHVKPATFAHTDLGDGRARFSMVFEPYASVLEWTELADRDSVSGKGSWTLPRADRDHQVTMTVTDDLNALRWEKTGLGDQAGDDNGAAIAERFSPEGRFATQFMSRQSEPTLCFIRRPGGEEPFALEGTIQTTTGDYRFMHGWFGGRMRSGQSGVPFRLQTFDGGHAFVFEGTFNRSRNSLNGKFYSGNWYEEDFRSVRSSRMQMPSAYGGTRATAEILAPATLEALPVVFGPTPDFSRPVPRLIYVFGTWCPNCKDATETIKALSKDFPEIEIIGVAFEHRADREPERARERVASYAEVHGIDWPVLLGGPSDKDKASEAFPLLDRVRAYPTTMFVHADGLIEAVRTGFSGPATGAAHAELEQRFRLIAEIITASRPNP